MNRATCGLQNLESPPSDNVTPQETTNQEVGETGLDGGSLPCPGSSVVADESEWNTTRSSEFWRKERLRRQRSLLVQ